MHTSSVSYFARLSEFFRAKSSTSRVEETEAVVKIPAQKPVLVRFDATNPSTNRDAIIAAIERDGGVIIENLITLEKAAQIKEELKPHFDTDRVDPSGFFPSTTQRATGLIGISKGCSDLLTAPLFIDVANEILKSTYSLWHSQERKTYTTKPVISSTVGFRVNPGGTQQVLHRDDGCVSD